MRRNSMNQRKKNHELNKSLEHSLVLEIKSHFKEKMEGLVAFGSNMDLSNFGRDYDLLIAVSSHSENSERELHSLITNCLLRFNIRIDMHLFDLEELSRALRRPDLIFISIAKKYKLLYGTERFRTIFQLIDTINERHDYSVLV